MKKKRTMPAVALRGLTIMPEMIIHFDLSRKKSILALEQAMIQDQKIFLVTQTNMEDIDPGIEQLYRVGTIALIKQITKLPGSVIRVLVEGLAPAQLLSVDMLQIEYMSVAIREIEIQEKDISEVEEAAMLRIIKGLFVTYSQYYPKIGKSLTSHMDEVQKIEILVNQITMSIPLNYITKQKMLETTKLVERYGLLAEILTNEIEVAKVKTELTEKVKERVEKNQKEYILREQMNYIRQELGEDDTFSDAGTFMEDLKKIKACKEVKERIKKEIARFKSISGNSSESGVMRGYIETLLELPWDKESKDNTDIIRAEEILNRDHYGLDAVKERILEFLAVRTLTKHGQSPIICLVGPPGTGKTSIAKSVAEALNKKYIRISLGGVRDEAEIRGHRKTYVGAMPGRIAMGLKQAGVKNPLMLLDEIDKVSSDYKGDTASALLEVLDSEQNDKFRDHYVEIPIDLSEVLFITTANTTTTIPRPLLDRMEIIDITSYTANEKFHIAKEHLVNKQLLKNGLSGKQLSFSDQALKNMIQGYVRESGVRELERKLGEICRKAAKEILKGKTEIHVTAGVLEKYLGYPKHMGNKANETDDVGIVRGLAWTSVGGETLQIEVNVMPGKGKVDLTGQMGDVMKESALAGISYIRSISNDYKLNSDFFEKNDFHIHIPEGAVPKDGPSAGITMATALLSAITQIPVKASVAMTGEITLRGRVLPIGGLKEKILAAKTAGIKTVLVPKSNQKDVEEISYEIKSGMEIYFVESMQEVINLAFADKKTAEENESSSEKKLKRGKHGN